MNRGTQNRLLLTSLFLIAVSLVLITIPKPTRTPVPGIFPEKNLSNSGLYVTEIVDGDTYVLSDGRAIRLIGVDTPESGMPYYEEAVSFAESLLMGEIITLKFDREDRDKYGRYLVYAYLDTIFVNGYIVGRGLGIVYLFESNIYRAGGLIESQKGARAADIGIWSLPDPPPEEYYVNIRGSYRFHRPLCTAIKKSNPGNKKIYYSREELLDRGFSPCRNCRP